MSKYFTNLNPGAKIHQADGGVIDLKRMPIDSLAKKLYLKGFKHIGITPDAAKIFKGCPKLVLENLISQKMVEKKMDEVKILQSVLDNKTKSVRKHKPVDKK